MRVALSPAKARKSRNQPTIRESSMSNTDRLLKLAVSSLLTLGAASVTSGALAAEPETEQCAGIIKAGKNDCATSTNACHGHVETDSNPEAWIYLPKGTCERLVGGHLVTVKDPTPKKTSSVSPKRGPYKSI
jgi:uncharacterized membrane protein